MLLIIVFTAGRRRGYDDDDDDDDDDYDNNITIIMKITRDHNVITEEKSITSKTPQPDRIVGVEQGRKTSREQTTRIGGHHFERARR